MKKLAVEHDDGRRIYYSRKHFEYVDDIMMRFDAYFNAVQSDGKTVDFTEPKIHLLPNGRSWWFPFLPEVQDEMQFYISEYKPKAGDIVLDAGGYSGLTATFFSELVGPTGKVIVLEPDKINHAILLKNVKHIKNIIPIKKALWFCDSTLEFCNHGGMGSTLSVCLNQNFEKTQIPTISIPSLEAQYGRFDFMKLDVEGAEFFVKQHIHHHAVIEIHKNHQIKELQDTFANSKLKRLISPYLFI